MTPSKRKDDLAGSGVHALVGTQRSQDGERVMIVMERKIFFLVLAIVAASAEGGDALISAIKSILGL